jgi:hypothetical protein
VDGLAAGTLVRHRTLGTGKVIAVEALALHVFFPGSDTRFAAKLRWPAAGAFLSREGLEADPWLQGLTSFAMDPASGRYALAANFIGQDEAVAIFLAENPGAFDPAPPQGRGGARLDRGARWRGAIAEWESVLGSGQADKLLADAEFEELSRRLLLVAGRAAAIPGMPEVADLEEAFETGDEVRHYLGALLGYLSVPSPARARFEKLCAAAHALGAPPDAAWPLVTFFPFVASPARHVVLVPRSACPGASRLGCDLQYQAAPSWVAYGRLRDLSTRLLAKLAPSGGRDHVDVECFLHATGSRRVAAARRTRAKEATPPAKPARTPSRRKR